MSEQAKSERFATVQRDGYDPAAVDEVIGCLEQAMHDLTAKCAELGYRGQAGPFRDRDPDV